MERRREPRERVLLRVDYRSEESLLADYATDVASGGLFLRTDLAFEVGDPLRLTLSFPGLLEQTVVNATVRWTRSSKQARASGEPVGVGVSFDEGQPAQMSFIQRLIARLRSAQSTGSRAKDRGLDVLLVDDNRFVQDLFRHALRRYHADHTGSGALRIHEAFTGHEALRLLKDLDPDLAIIDHFLPGMSGADLVRHIRTQARWERLPVLVVSTGGREARTEALASGATVYLDKPVLLTQLVSTIRALLVEGP